MSDRLQTPLVHVGSEGSSQSDERVANSTGPDLAKFQALVASLMSLDDADRAEAAATINDLLIAMRAPGNDAAEAALILKELDLKAFTALTDRQGRNCRKEAVETLMKMGFPHALKISPQDFEYAQQYVSPSEATGAQQVTSGRYVFLAQAVAYLLAALGSVANVAALWNLPHGADGAAGLAGAMTFGGLFHAAAVAAGAAARGNQERAVAEANAVTGMWLGLALMFSAIAAYDHPAALLGFLCILAAMVALVGIQWWGRRH